MKMNTGVRHSALFCSLLMLQLLYPFAAMTQPMAPTAHIQPNGPQVSAPRSPHMISNSQAALPGQNFDLSSTQRSASSASFGQTARTLIHEGGSVQSILPSSAITPAENIALQQVLSAGRQSLILGKDGSAIGGSAQVTLSSSLALSTLVIPSGVTVSRNFGTAGALNVIGNIVDSGSFFAFSTNTQTTTAAISASNIFVQPGGLLTSVLPKGGLSGVSGAIPNLNLSLTALHNIVNSGEISSSGNLYLQAGAQIINGASHANSGASGALIQAPNDIALMTGTGSFINSGIINSITGNINVDTETIQNIVFNNAAGRLEAANGSINIRDKSFAGHADTTLNGGDWLSQQLNVYSGCGKVNLNVGEVSGTVNAVGGSFDLVAKTNTLQLGNLHVSGDPAILQTGDVVITQPLIFSGQPLTIIAGGRIISGSGASVIDTSSATGNGGEITLIAGAMFTQSNGQADVLGPSSTGGYIDLTGASVSAGSPITRFVSSSSAAAGNGGNISMVAFAGSSYDGRILLPSALTVQSGGNGGSNGNVLVVSGTPNSFGSPASSINIGSIDTEGNGNGTGGNITITTASPILSSLNPACLSCLIVNTSSGAVSGNIGAGILQAMSITTGSLTSGAGTTRINSGYNLLVNGDINASVTAGGNAGAVVISTNSPDAFHLGAGTIANGVTGSVNASSSGGASGNGGSIDIVNNGPGGIVVDNLAGIATAANTGGGNGGAISLAAPGSNIIIAGNNTSFNTNGSVSGNGGSVTLLAQNIYNQTSSPVTISASGAGGGNGGTISVTETSASSILNVGTNPSDFQVFATGGSAGSASGDGGSITLSAGSRLSVDTACESAAPLGNSGTGGDMRFSATGSTAGNLYVNGSLSANGTGSGNGGNISLTSTSSVPFVVGSSWQANGVAGTLSADGGNTGHGGSVTIVANGSGGVVVNQSVSARGGSTSGDGGTISISSQSKSGIAVQSTAALSVTTVSGNGGSISLSAPQGPLAITGGSLSADANGGDFGGGTISLLANSLSITNGSAFSISANGSGLGNGGSISLTTNTGYENLTVGSAAGDFELSATSGSNGGNGGAVSVSSGGSLFVNPSYVTVAPRGANGNGGAISLSAGKSHPAVLEVTGPLSVAGAGTGNGGSLSLTVNSDQPFTISSTAQPINGIWGSVHADSGYNGGDGGSISIQATGAGGINVSDITLVSSSATGGAGGNILLDAGSGLLQLGAGAISVNAGGSSDNNGGSITLVGSPVQVNGAGLLQLSADGIAGGNGGNITIISHGTALGSLDNLVVGPTSLAQNSSIGYFKLSATSGAAGGNGGSILVSTGANLIVNPAYVNANPIGSAGNGGTYTLVAGTALPGNLTISGSLLANGVGTGNGGTILLSSNSATPFSINAGTTSNGIKGTVSAASGTQSGYGGNITIENQGLGGINIIDPAGSISVPAVQGNGGNISLIAPDGVIQIDTSVSNTLSSNAASTAGSGNFNGGNIIIDAGLLTITGPASLSLQANAVNNGNGGSVTVIDTSALGSLTVGKNAGQLQVQALGGSASSAAGNGGAISLSSGLDLQVVDVSALAAEPLGFNGNGAHLYLTAGTAAPGSLTVANSINADGIGNGSGGVVELQSSGNLLVTGDISAAAGSGIGNGGTISIVANTFNVVETGSSAARAGVTGAISVNAGSSGDGGSITIVNNGFGGISIDNLMTISTAVTNGAGADITISAPQSFVVLSPGALSADGAGTNSPSNGFSGGQITLEGLSVGVSNGGIVNLSANGSGSGDGGTICIQATGSTSRLNIGAVPSGFTISATGGSSGSAYGDGGVVNLTAGSNLIVNPIALSINPLGQNGAGGKLGLALLSGTACCGLVVNGDLSLDGVGSGDGGHIVIVNNSPSTFSIGIPATPNGIGGILSANGGNAGEGPGNGGVIQITDTGKGGIALGIGFSITAQSFLPGGNGGVIELNAPNGPLTVAGGNLNASAAAGNGGSIQLQSTVIINSQSNGAVIADASGAVQGGVITLTTTLPFDLSYPTGSGNIVIGGAPGDFNIRVTGGTPGSLVGNGGTVNISSAAAAVIDMNFLSADPVGVNGNGAVLNFSAVSNLFAHGSLDVSGVGYGSGGEITLSSQSTGPFGYFSILPGTAYNGVDGSIRADAGTLGGNGGSIAIIVPNTLLLLPGGETLSANANGNDRFNGGSITIVAHDFYNISAGPLKLTANGSGTGNGGMVSFTEKQPVKLEIIGDVSNGLLISATGGSAGSLAGNGGTVILNTAGNLTVDPHFLNINPLGLNGNGGNYTFNHQYGTMVINGTIDASGVGYGNGGSINISTSTGTPFGIGAGAFFGVNGVNGDLLANAGSAGGNGGTIAVNTFGETDFVAGPTISANAAGAGVFNGGTISIDAARVDYRGSFQGPHGVALLSANGSGMGDGGSITVAGRKAFTSITVGTGDTDIEVSATGGSAGSFGGNGGSIKIIGNYLTIAPSALTAGPLGIIGNGANIDLEANQYGPGVLYISSSLSADGAQIGSGGAITLVSGFALPFQVNTGFANYPAGAPRNGISGILSASAGSSFGSGGMISISTTGPQGIVFGAAPSVLVDPSVQSGGSGGTINVNAPNGTVSFLGAGLSANASLNGNGGQITIVSTAVSNLSSLPLALAANGAGNGNGGQIILDSSLRPDIHADLQVGQLPGQFVLSATGGSIGSLWGDGGSVTVRSGRTLTVDTSAINVNPLGINGNGGSVTLVSGTVPSGDLVIHGNLSADGVGIGNGGSLNLTTSSNSGFAVNTSGHQSGISGLLTANGGTTAGNGGSITITSNFVTTAISLGQQSIFVNASTGGGNGGTINLLAPRGDISFSSDGLSANGSAGSGFGSYDGGQINIIAGGQIGTPHNAALLLQANSGGTGNGGSITVSSSDVSNAGALSVGSQSGDLQLSATGGYLGRSGNGGTIVVSAARDLTVDPTGINISALGMNGNGGSISLSAGTRVPSELLITGSLSANGTGCGNGGSIILSTWTQNAPFQVSGVSSGHGNGGNNNNNNKTAGVEGILTADAGSLFGNGGSVTVINSGVGGIVLGPNAPISVAASTFGGNGGSITVSSEFGSITSTGPGLSADASATGNFHGGNINMLAEQYIGPASQSFLLSAVGHGDGSGGNITVTAARVGYSDLFIGDLPTELKLDVRGGTDLAGEGGSITATARGTLTVNSSGLSLLSSPYTGANVTLSAANHQAGNIAVNGVIDAGMGFKDSLSLILNLTGDIDQSNGGLLEATHINLRNTFGGIGSNTFHLTTQTPFLTVNTRGSAYISNNGPVVIGASSAGYILQISSSGPIYTNSGINTVVLNLNVASGANAGITIGGSVISWASTNLLTDGYGSILQLNGDPIMGQNINLSSPRGDIGEPFAYVGLTGPTYGTYVAPFAVSANAGDSIFIKTVGPAYLNNVHAGGQLVIDACGPLSLTQNISSGNGPVSIGQSSGLLQIFPSASLISSGSLEIVHSGGSMQIMPSTQIIAGGSVEISNSGGWLQILPGVTISAGTSLSILNSGGGMQIFPGDKLSATNNVVMQNYGGPLQILPNVSVSSSNGSLSLTNSGSLLQVSPGSSLSASNGSIQLKNTGGWLEILPNVSLQAGTGFTINNIGGTMVLGSSLSPLAGTLSVANSGGWLQILPGTSLTSPTSSLSLSNNGGWLVIYPNDTISAPNGTLTINNKQGGVQVLPGTTISAESDININNTGGSLQLFPLTSMSSTAGSISISNSGGFMQVLPSAQLHAANSIDITNSGGMVQICVSGAPNATTAINAGTSVQLTNDGGALVLYGAGPNAPSIINSANGTLGISESGGALILTSFSKLTANAGDLVLNNLDSSTGNIQIGYGSQLSALAQTTASGNIRIVVGPIGAPVAGTQPADVSVQTSSGGQVYFGNSSITAYGPTSTLKAVGSQLQFDSGSQQGPQAIVLLGSVFMLADPPATPAMLKSLLPNSGTWSGNTPSSTFDSFSNATAAPSAIIHVQSALSGMPPSLSNTNYLAEPFSIALPASDTTDRSKVSGPAVHYLPDGDNEKSTDSASADPKEQIKRSNFEPVSFVSGAESYAGRAIPRLNTMVSSTATIKYIDGAVASLAQPDTVTLNSNGQVLIHANVCTRLKTKKNAVLIPSGLVALASLQGDVLEVSVMEQRTATPLKVLVDGHVIDVHVGQQVVVGPSADSVSNVMRKDKFGRRRTAVVNGIKDCVVTCEVSPVSLMQQSEILLLLRQSTATGDRSLTSDLMKASACLMQVTAKHGSYSRTQ